MHPAAIVTEDGRDYWMCPNCGQKLAEIIGTQVVISAGKIRVFVESEKEPGQACFRCGMPSVLKTVDEAMVA